MTLAGVFAGYYFSRGQAESNWPAVSSAYRTLRYSFGSIALGSFIIAVVMFIRIILDYIDRQTKKQQQANCLLRWCMCCIKARRPSPLAFPALPASPPFSSLLPRSAACGAWKW